MAAKKAAKKKSTKGMNHRGGKAKARKVVKRMANKKPAKAAKKTAAKPAVVKVVRAKSSWLDDDGSKPAIDKYARRLSGFLEAMADGVIDSAEVKAQEARLVKLMKEVEPLLNADLHVQVTRLLCELTAYDIMQIMNLMHESRPATQFRG